MSKFNKGRPYHGSTVVDGGKVRGATDTDYFYFFCPQCEGNEMLRLLDYEIRHEQADNPYNLELKPKAERGFVIAFKIHCQRCGLTDFIKVSNLGWQGGKHQQALKRSGHAPE